MEDGFFPKGMQNNTGKGEGKATVDHEAKEAEAQQPKKEEGQAEKFKAHPVWLALSKASKDELHL
eukprot:2045406-Prorocentrum_lima.AAC.1